MSVESSETERKATPVGNIKRKRVGLNLLKVVAKGDPGKFITWQIILKC